MPQRRVYEGPIDARGAHFGTGRVIDGGQSGRDDDAPDAPAPPSQTTVTFNGPVDVTGSLLGNGDLVNYWGGEGE